MMQTIDNNDFNGQKKMGIKLSKTRNLTTPVMDIPEIVRSESELVYWELITGRPNCDSMVIHEIPVETVKEVMGNLIGWMQS